MNNSFNKKLSDLLGRMDEKVLQAKLNKAFDMLQNGDTEEIARKINKIDKNELIEKINDFDTSKLDNLNIDKEDLKKMIAGADMVKLHELLGEKGDVILNKIIGIIG
jgi:transcriptional regulator of aromatic amino acid metabolism